MTNISTYVKPNMVAARSINLERDAGLIGVVNDYQVTDKTLEILDRFADALHGEKVSAWSLTGPYGMGKSSFLNYFIALTSAKDAELTKKAWQKLKVADKNIYEKLTTGTEKIKGEGFIQIPVTAAYESVNTSVKRAINNVLENMKTPKAKKIQTRLNQNRSFPVDGQLLIDTINDLFLLTNKPIIMVIDEFGKNLDYMSHHPHKGDIFLLQQLAELNSVFLWVSLHQAFDEYSAVLSIAQQQEWRKIQGRFEDISFVESTGEMLRIISRSLKQSKAAVHKKALNNWAQKVSTSLYNLDIVHKSFFTPDIIKSIYPLHPITAIALIELCRSYAQNDRTLVSFLSSGDWGALSAFLEKEIHEETNLPTVGLNYLYDYFFSISAHKPNFQMESQKWLEIHNIISEKGSLVEQESDLLKTIGVLNLISRNSGIKSDYTTVNIIMEYTGGHTLEETERQINELISRKEIFYRDFAAEIRLWEGSDFDVYENIRTQKAKMSISSLDQVLEEYLPLSPIIASRHAIETGTIRRFERRWLSYETLSDKLTPAPGYDGLLVYCFGTESSIEPVPKQCADGRPLLIAYVATQTTLNELALEAAATKYVFDNSPELKHDRVARREISYRVIIAEQQFRKHVSQLYAPTSEDISWFARGKEIKIDNYKKQSEAISRLCDDSYHACPYIGNEMINYNKISAAAAWARRELAEAMVMSENEEELGLSGYGPEVALYRSLLLAHGLHCKKGNEWHLNLTTEDEKLNKLWQEIEKNITANEEGISVADILTRLQEPPWGMRQGVAPIYICLYLVVKADDIAIFREGTYVPYLTEATIALLLKRPDLFALKRFISSGIEQKVFNVYRKFINIAIEDSGVKLRNTTMIGVVGPLIKYIESLPQYSRNTREISLEAQRIRTAIINATEPMQLLFTELPQAVGLELSEISNNDSLQEELHIKLRAALNELGQAFPQLNERVQELLVEFFGHVSIEILPQVLNKRITPLIPICSDIELKAFLQALVRKSSSTEEWVEGIAGSVAKKPLDAWNDHDFMPFAAKLRDYVERIDLLETLKEIASQPAKGRVVLSVMNGAGKTERLGLVYPSQANARVNDRVEEILDLPQEETRQVLFALIDHLLLEGGGVNG